MKKLILVSLVLLSVTFAIAQRPDMSAQCKEAMKKLAYFVGDWQGTATVQSPQGPMTLQQTEHIQWQMDGLLLQIEGIGRQNDQIKFHAMAIVNFDPTDQQFKFKSFVKEGFSTNAYFKELKPNQFEWGFDVPSGGKTRYVITLDDQKGTWHETGEYSRDGNTWMRFIEMNLTKG
ncbi:MAG: hypothetical protein AB7K37_14360 [Cyclobacteriaceae bacterium]